MLKILIYGAGVGGERLLEEMRINGEPYEMIAFIDRRIGGTEKDGIPVIFPEDISKYQYDIIFVATLDHTVPDTLREKYGVPTEKINYGRYFNSVEIAVRIRALERFKELSDIYGLYGSVAEVGVYQGDFAKQINRVFPESKLYLYDTFEGFNRQDIEKEQNKSHIETYKHYANTTVDLVLNKLPYPEKAIIRKGFFPDTADGQDDQYVFVNLDADLYGPTLAGLEFFWPRMVRGGAIFVHDYFAPEFTGVKKAITEFMRKTSITIGPIGDFRTVSIMKPFGI
ncbi:MAG: hypothetical protein HFI66_02675 [Lachnospiraceae bacterium]|nr:hypothetical protein [Lachnospiraceae bacterium]